MEPKDRIIVAIDTSDVKEAISLVETLSPYVGCFKIGLRFIYSSFCKLLAPASEDSAFVLRDTRYLFRLLDGNIFLDSELNDISNTVAGAAKAITQFGVKMLNINCFCGLEAMIETRQAIEKVVGKKKPLILGETILASFDHADLQQICIGVSLALKYQNDLRKEDIEKIIKSSTFLAKEASLDGVICSLQEIRMIREQCGADFKVIALGVQSLRATADDLIMAPVAIKAGADYLVIGRPITNPPKEIGGPVEAVKRILDEIASVV